MTVLVLKIDTMTKATNKGRHLIWGSFYSFITIWYGGDHGGRQAWQWSSSWEITSDPQVAVREGLRLGVVWPFET